MAQTSKQHVGHGQSLAGGGTIVITNSGVATVVGNELTCCVAYADDTKSVASITDPGGNSWTLKKRTTVAGKAATEIWGAPCTGAVANGQNFTVTHSAAAAALGTVDEFTNTLNAADSTNTANGTGTNPSGADTVVNTSGAVVVAVIGAVDPPADGQSVSEAGGWNTMRDVAHTLASVYIHAAYKIVTAAGSQTYAPTLSVSIGWDMSLAAFANSAPGTAGQRNTTGAGL